MDRPVLNLPFDIFPHATVDGIASTTYRYLGE